MSTAVTPNQIAYATKLRELMAHQASLPITDATIFSVGHRQKFEILGYATPADFKAAVPDQDERRALIETVTPAMITADARERAEQLRARQAELGAARVESMSKTQISAYIDAAKGGAR